MQSFQTDIFFRYANPLKEDTVSNSLNGSVGCLKSGIAGPQVSTDVGKQQRPLSEAGVSNEGLVLSSPSGARAHAHRGSQILLYKAQNPDIRNNTAGVFDDVTAHKDFGKRVINMNVLPSGSSNSGNNAHSPTEVLTVLV